ALTPAMDAVLGALPPARAGSGSALTMTMRQVGGALGVAILGSVLAGAYAAQAPVAGRESLPAAAAYAARTGDPAVLVGGQHAYLHAMDRVLLVCAAVALLGALSAALFLPALRHVMSMGFSQMGPVEVSKIKQRTKLMLAVPALRMRMLDNFNSSVDMLAGAVARRTGRDPAELEVRAFAGALTGAM